MQGSNAELLEEVRAPKRDIITAPAMFTTHVNTFLSLAEQLETSLKEGDEQEFEYFNIPLPFATVVPTTAPAPAPDPPILPVPPQTPLFMSRGSLYVSYLASLLSLFLSLSLSLSLSLPLSLSLFLFLLLFFYRTHSTHFLNIRNGSIVNEMKYGDQIKEWLPSRRFELLYKATVYVPPEPQDKEKGRRRG